MAEIKYLPHLLITATILPLITCIITYTLSYTVEFNIPEDQPIPFISTTLNDPPGRYFWMIINFG